MDEETLEIIREILGFKEGEYYKVNSESELDQWNREMKRDWEENKVRKLTKIISINTSNKEVIMHRFQQGYRIELKLRFEGDQQDDTNEYSYWYETLDLEKATKEEVKQEQERKQKLKEELKQLQSQLQRRKAIMDNITLGFEIEGIYRDIFDYVGDYHEGEEFTVFWSVEHDGSIYENIPENHPLNRVEQGIQGCELVSGILTYKNYKTALRELKRSFGENFNENIHFNKSCGAHIHFALNKVKLKKLITIYSETKLQKMFFKELDLLVKKGKLRKTLSNSIKGHYYRRTYATNRHDRNHRYSGLNFNTCRETIEWRNFNLLGVKSWEEMFLLYDLAVNTIIKFLTDNFRKETKTTIMIDRDEKVREIIKGKVLMVPSIKTL